MVEKNKNGSPAEELLLKNLISTGEWQKIQDSFSSIANMCIRTVDINGILLTTPSMESRLCKLIKNTPKKDKICGICLPTFLGGRALVDKNLSFSCFAGTHQFLVPLRLPNEKIICYMLFGPVILVMRKSKEEYRETAEELNIGLGDFWDSLLEIRVISFNTVQTVVELVKNIGEYILKLAFRHTTIEEEVEEMRAPLSPQLSSLFHVFLDVAVQASGADIGSIMLLDESSKELTIRSSYGLPDEIAKNTKVRLGEGLSGMVAKENKLLLISEKPEENRIKRYLNRPYIASSMIIPIKLKDKVLGVINLASLQTSSVRFDTDKAETINKLTKLTTLALQTPISK